MVRYCILGVFSTFFVTKLSKKVHRVLWLDTVYWEFFSTFFVTKLSKKVHRVLWLDTVYWEFFYFFCHKIVKERFIEYCG